MVQPFSLKDAPALIEVALPVQKLSAEAQKERKAGAGQTLTALGSYWKGRKPLILAKACILGCLLPATVNTAKDIEIFEKLIGIDDDAFAIRADLKADTIVRTIALDDIDPLKVFRFNRPKGEEPTQFPYRDELDENLSLYGSLKAAWKPKVPKATKVQLQKRTLKKLKLSYMQKLDISARPEEVGDELHDGIWRDVNKHLGTEAHSIPELVEQLGIMRFGHRPRVADTFCGGGSIPFEAARLGCDVYASDLNPVACMLTWAALNIIGADEETRKKISESQRYIANAIASKVRSLEIEHNDYGDRAKAFLYCLETRCPQTGWMVPLAPNWIISNNRKVIGKLIPDYENKRFEIVILSGVSEIIEYFIAWLRKNPPEPFKNWIWDSRRQLAIQGSGDDFRREMARAYAAMTEHMPDNGMQVIMFTHQGVEVWADMASIVWGSGLRVVQAWYIATETTSELKKGGYVQGTVLMVVRKRQHPEQIYKDELVIEIRQEVEQQINIMLDLNQEAKRQERYDNLFTDADLYMAGYAAALKVLTSYTHIGSTDMTQATLRPRQAGQDSFVDEMVELARNIAGQILVPEGLYGNDLENAVKLWGEKLAGSDRFYLKMLDLEATGIHKLDNYQNFAKAFKVDYAPLMGNQKSNAARLKSALEFKKAEVAGFEFERSIVRSILYALYQLQTEVETDLVLDQFWDNCRGKFNPRDREDIHHLCNYIALKLKDTRPEEASAARVFAGLLKTEHL